MKESTTNSKINYNLLTVKDAARIKKCSPETIQYHITHKNFPAVMVLGQWVMNERDLERLNVKPRNKTKEKN